MKLEEMIVTVTRIVENVDNEGCIYLKCKGYNSYRTTVKGRKVTGFNFFTSVKLYPVNQEQLDETKNRLFSQDTTSPKLKILCYDCNLTTNLIGGKIIPLLTVNKYDFVTHKLFDKRNLLAKKEKKNE